MVVSRTDVARHALPVDEDLLRVSEADVPLQGDIPSPVNPPSGCVFRTRCPLAVEACALSLPPLDEMQPGRFSACIRKDLMLTPSP